MVRSLAPTRNNIINVESLDVSGTQQPVDSALSAEDLNLALSMLEGPGMAGKLHGSQGEGTTQEGSKE